MAKSPKSDLVTVSTGRYRVARGERVDLASRPTCDEPVCGSRAAFGRMLAAHVSALTEQQARLYASGSHAVLMILQGMDAAGKDGVIKHVMSGVNPQGCAVTSFKQPTAEELRHDFLWRAAEALPGRGVIGLFNRSYYEEVLVVRVHRDLLEGEGLDPEHGRKRLWRDRYRSIRDFEAHLRRNRTSVVKIFLHVSKEEQRRRFLARIDDSKKNWKLSPADITERNFWDKYQKAYAQCIEATTSKSSPWYVVPADDKVSARLIVSQILLDTLTDLDLQWPHATADHRAELERVRSRLTAEDPA
jgi:PPK2 family polyphosphate:nucleotide phosphotransferase